MGAGNALRVYNAWGGKLSGKPLALLAYMALHSRDGDSDPWYGLGHADLAVHVFGIDLKSHIDPRKRDVQLRKVRRHVTPLFLAKAIETKDRATYGLLGEHHVVYRLFLDGPGISSNTEALRQAGLRASQALDRDGF